ncbi:MAG: energy-coupling factor transporter ATPase [Desulfobacca sp.]|nr:energy-coupling factor transporter ATPase [Desulfobacca sp.]
MLKIRQLSFQYRQASFPTLRHLDFDLGPGERVAVLGPSESGKSTLALCLNGLIPRLIKGDFEGDVQVAGCSTLTCRPRQLASRVGVLFQDFESQLFCTRVDLEVAFGPENLGLPRTEIRRRVQASLNCLGLESLTGRDPATLSGGQKQLLALASVLALQPQLLVLDEPTSDLDPWRVENLLDRLQDLRREQNLSLLLLGQDLRLSEHCDRLVLLDQGSIVATGPPGDILRQIQLFQRLGLSPNPLAALFYDLGQPQLPLTLEEAEAMSRKLGWHKVTTEPDQTRKPARARPGPEILALRDISFRYPDSPPVFQNLSLSFRQGELAAILGPNGSGKTTLLKLLRGLLSPQQGELWLGRHPDQPEQMPRLGFVFQNPDYQLFAEQVWEEVAFGPRQLGLGEAEIQARVAAALQQVRLADLAEDDPFSLTKGQRQRLAVASVLALAPTVIILDEPTTGLDHNEQLGMMNLIRDLNRQGHTIIMVTHSMWAAAEYSQRLIILQDGRLILDGPTREVLAQEEVLAACHLVPPAVVRLARRLGFSALSAAEFQAHLLLFRTPKADRPGSAVPPG